MAEVDMSKVILAGNKSVSYDHKADREHALEVQKKYNLKTSQLIRYLAQEGWSRGRITKAMPAYDHGGEFRYQHVKNVLDQQAKKNGVK